VLRVIFAVFGAAGRDPVAAAESLISLTVLALFGVSFYQMAVLRRPARSASRRSADGGCARPQHQAPAAPIRRRAGARPTTHETARSSRNSDAARPIFWRGGVAFVSRSG